MHVDDFLYGLLIAGGEALGLHEEQTAVNSMYCWDPMWLRGEAAVWVQLMRMWGVMLVIVAPHTAREERMRE